MMLEELARPTPQPHETCYNGYRFRSRLEARWAVFFDAAGIEYQYEPEGFKMSDGARYLPDFYLPKYHTWVEIKGPVPSEAELHKMMSFAREMCDMPVTGIRFRLLRQIPSAGPIFCYIYFGPEEYRWAFEKSFPGADISIPEYGSFIPGFWVPAATTETVNKALIKARQARFEHGEKP